jgi:two-component system sensor histidine kinase HydH
MEKDQTLVIDRKYSRLADANSEQQMKKMNMLGQLAFGMIHDIRNSLQILRASSSMIKKHTDNEAVTRNAEAIDAVVENTSKMIERVLSFSNTSADVISEIDLSIPIHEIVALSRYILPPHITIEYAHPPAPMCIMGNGVELSQAMLNLIKNGVEAIEPMQREGVITISVKECFPWIEVKVKDNGCGIAPDEVEKVFDPLFTTKKDGTGIGLVNVWATVESHGGIISVTSELGQGTEFILMFPKKN